MTKKERKKEKRQKKVVRKLAGQFPIPILNTHKVFQITATQILRRII